MSAIQLLEKLSKDSEYRSKLVSGNSFELASSITDEIDNQQRKSPVWCVFVPAEDEDQNQDEDQEGNDEKVSIH